MRGEKHEKHEYVYSWEYRVYGLSDMTRRSYSKETKDLPFTDQEKSEMRKDAKEHQAKLIKALQEYDIANRNLNSQNNSHNEGR